MANLLPNLIQKFFYADGTPLVGGKLYTYDAGTTTPLATYTDETEGASNTNPIILDADGSAQVWIGSAAYKFVLKDPSDVVLFTRDNVSWINSGTISNVKLANMADGTIKGRVLGSGAGVPVDMTGAQVTPALSVMTGDSGAGGVKGLVPAPGVGDTAAGKFLAPDATWKIVSVATAMIASGAITFAKLATDILHFVVDAFSLNWSYKLMSANSNTWVAAAYGSGVFVAVAPIGTIPVNRTTDYGQNWITNNPPEANQWQSIAFGNGIFVAVANNGTHAIMRSTDLGLTWTAVYAPANYTFTVTAANATIGATYTNNGNTYTVTNTIAGTTTLVTTSPLPPTASGTLTKTTGTGDATITFSAFSVAGNQWKSIAYGNSVFVAVANSGTNRTMRSTDFGVTWTSAVAAAANQWVKIAYGNSVFVAVSDSGTNRTMRSTDFGLTWTAVVTAASNAFVSIAYGGGVFVILSSDGTSRTQRSTDLGLTWSAVATPEQNTWKDIAYGNGTFIIVATSVSSSGFQFIARSIDLGVTWTGVSGVLGAAGLGFITGVTYGSGMFVVLAGIETAMISLRAPEVL